MWYGYSWFDHRSITRIQKLRKHRQSPDKDNPTPQQLGHRFAQNFSRALSKKRFYLSNLYPTTFNSSFLLLIVLRVSATLRALYITWIARKSERLSVFS
jgi:hypothetical protein